jgi:hypothetical protein
MNSLIDFVVKYELRAGQSMNILQEKGIISDNAIVLEDVAEADCKRAIEFLRQHTGHFNFGNGNNRKCPLCGVPVSRCCC